MKFNVLLGAIVGGLFLGAAFQAGCGAVESYIEKVGRKCDFEYGKSRMWGSLGWAAATFFAGQLFNINPNINFWLASDSALCLVLILLMTKIDLTASSEEDKQEPIKMKDVFGILKLKKFWFFVLHVFGVVCFYSIYDQQFPIYHALELPIMLIAVFKYLAQHFDNCLSSTLYLVGFQFASVIAVAFLSPIVGQLYDSIGFSPVYFIISGIILLFNVISMFTLNNDKKETVAVQEFTQAS